jgi:hypothetical protein
MAGRHGTARALVVAAALAGWTGTAVAQAVALHESFEAPGQDGWPPDWQSFTAVVLGSGAVQDLAVVPGAGRGGGGGLRARAQADTQRFVALESPPVATAAGDAWLVSGWLTGRAVTRESRQSGSCGVFLRALDVEGSTVSFGRLAAVATSPVAGTFAWTRLERRVLAPPLAAAVRIGASCSASGEVVFDDLRLERLPAHRGARVLLHARTTDRAVAAALVARAERALGAAEEATALRWPADAVLNVHLYDDRDEKRAVTGLGGNAHAVLPDQVHVLDEALDSTHEAVHLLAALHLNPQPAALLGEGLAVAAGATWQGEPVDRAAARLLAEGRLPSLGALLPTSELRRLPDAVTYPVAGSFVRFLFAACGDGGATELYRRSAPEDDVPQLSKLAEQSCGAGLGALEAAWKELLKSRVPEGAPPPPGVDVSEDHEPEPSRRP